MGGGLCASDCLFGRKIISTRFSYLRLKTLLLIVELTPLLYIRNNDIIISVVLCIECVFFYRQLVLANEWRVLALDEVDEDEIYRVCTETIHYLHIFSFSDYSSISML